MLAQQLSIVRHQSDAAKVGGTRTGAICVTAFAEMQRELHCEIL